MSWWESLRSDALAPLLASDHAAIRYWTSRDLLREVVQPPEETLWDLPVPLRILQRQSPEGSWEYPGGRPRRATDYDLLETYRQLGFLVEMFGLTGKHPGLAAAGEYVFARQAPEGDIRGIYGSQLSPNYTAALVALLVKAGCVADPRIERAFAWLEHTHQDDGGWALPLRTRGRSLDAIGGGRDDRERPLSPLLTPRHGHSAGGLCRPPRAQVDSHRQAGGRARGRPVLRAGRLPGQGPGRASPSG